MLIRSVPLFLLILAMLGTTCHAASDEGKRLYLQHCAACHGDAGDGGVGIPLDSADFQSGVTDAYLAKTIRLGRPGRVMPAFSRLSDNKVTALVKFIRSWGTDRQVLIQGGKIRGNKENGRKLYTDNCASCHGLNGEGGSGTGVAFSRPRNLPIVPPALNNSGFLEAASDNLIKNVLVKGREGTPMVSFLKKGLSEKEIDDLVVYVRSFQTHQPADEPRLSSQPAVLIQETDDKIEAVLERVKQAILGANFRLIRIQKLEEGLAEPGKESSKTIMVYFCNFEFLYRALEIDPRVGIFLPCRVTLVEKNGKTKIIAVNPQKMSPMFNNEKLDAACEQMNGIYESILEESTL